MAQNQIQLMPSTIMFDYNVTLRTNPTLLDLCLSHEFFIKGNFSISLVSKTCEEKEIKYQQQLGKLPAE